MEDKIIYSLIRCGFLGTIFYISKNMYENIMTTKLLYEKEIKELRKRNDDLREINNNYLEEIEEKDKIIKELLEENKKKKKDRNKIVIEYEDLGDD